MGFGGGEVRIDRECWFIMDLFFWWILVESLVW